MDADEEPVVYVHVPELFGPLAARAPLEDVADRVAEWLRTGAVIHITTDDGSRLLLNFGRAGRAWVTTTIPAEESTPLPVTFE